ncbi:TolC family protein [Gracilinema caldarium]|uniref:Outer membrane efflux protein n=1 Tax=Gracilinema caldarium (strain ATCC 51460 / DSM 7334 / H1) TaxID=744872 RepID=F8EWX2_GRAC1|nr:TolC family protein [Gracilinema caldarium]AEJ18358.1 outer membrane efflux protein [Gracilinema caldarium DSM 7334]
MEKIKIAFLVFFAVGCGTLIAQEPYTLSIDKAVALAIEHNLSLSNTKRDLETKLRKADTAWNVFIPTVDVSGTMARTNEASTVSALVPVSPTGPGGSYDYVLPYSQTLPQWSLSSRLSASLTFNIALFEGIKNVRMEYENGKISYQKARLQLERDIRKSYLQILLLKENIVLLQENISAAERRLEIARANYRAGLVPELTVLQAQVGLENLRPSLQDLQNNLQIATESLAMNLGLPHGTKLELETIGFPDPISLDMENFISTAINSKPDLEELRRSIALLKSTRQANWYQLYTPSVSLGWTYDPTFQGDPMKDNWFNGDAWQQRSGMFSITLAWRLNSLLPVSREAQGLVDLDDSLEKMNTSLALAVRGTETEVYAVVLQLQKSQKSIEALQLNVKLASRAYTLAEDAYRAGTKDVMEVTNAELDLRKAQLEVLKEQYNYMTGLLDLEYSIGVPFGTLTRR